MYASNPYQQQAAETASPAKLVLMLYDGVLTAIERVRYAGPRGENEIVNRELQRAQDIITELTVTLDRDRGGAVAANLAALYDFCMDRLITANVRKDIAVLEEVEPVVRGLRDAWDEACCRVPVGVAS
jgi:flagellar secretion chaperone FliS